ncbi:ABC transporter substrate-binding protein [Saccharopolyspora phatthalungensis]|uniref:Peptide/nickel transport system substrate-binding protein n=1 Tax=Saccharopolyspora phatthalungensis TaxID=664693 RepID=A0A840Q486_9PSEU|nr:ABC transporter substrate-binding protein [Saccharopolyspora phatthalungensis]MBB5153548.1 peptide/nickel transport system substrate-binding protein [Saccharopolyspora phatthalungensis]
MTIRTTAWIASLAVSALLLVGCGAGGTTDDQSAGPPVPGGTLTWAIPGGPAAGGLDPMVGTSLAAQVVNDVAYDTLLTKDDSGQIRPGLAVSWEQPDGLTYVFKLRENVTFADGSKFSADDVVYTFDTYMKAKTSKRTYLVNVKSVEATGDNEVTFRLSKPDGTFLNAMSGSQTFFIVGRKGYGNATEQERQTRTFGTGAFQVVDWKDGVNLTLEKNKNYWEAQKPYLDKIVFEIIPDESTRLAALQQGSAQAAYFGDGGLADQAAQSGFTLGNPAYTQNISIYVNPESGPLSDIRVRRAISLALDRQALVNTAMLGHGAVSFIPPAGEPEAPKVDKDTPYYTRDVGEAKKLLAEAGQPNPEITLTYMGDAAAAQHPIYELMQQQLAEAGIKLKLQAKPLAEIAPTFTSGESFVDLISIPGTPKADPLFYFDPVLAEKGVYNHWKGNPDADRARALFAEARSTTDHNAYVGLVDQLSDELAKQAMVFVPMSVPVYFEVWDNSKLHGYQSDPYYSRYRLNESWLEQ